MTSVELLEVDRLTKQKDIDSIKSLKERNVLGQYATPPSLSKDIAVYAQSLLDDSKVRFLEPAIGTGSFFSAILQVFGAERIETAKGFEVDEDYANIAINNWEEHGLKVVIKDFTISEPKPNERYNLLVTNPPYSRHHHLRFEHKQLLKEKAKRLTGLNLSGLTGLYCYFIMCAHQWLEKDGISIWLIPSDFMDINYGHELKRYLTENVQLIRIHRFNPEDLQFSDALVSSCVVVFKNRLPDKTIPISFTFGGSLLSPVKNKIITLDQLAPSNKWSHIANNIKKDAPDINDVLLSDIFDIRRGIATGDNKYFILTGDEVAALGISHKYLTPILPSPRFLKHTVIDCTHNKYPLTEKRLFLINSSIPLEVIKDDCRALYDYLLNGEKKNIHLKYMPSRRTPWYKQEKRSPAPFLCTYMGRQGIKKDSFRFIWNKSNAIATNTYLLLYPKKQILDYLENNPDKYEALFNELRALSHKELVKECRTYGGGLQKLEPKELGNVKANSVLKAIGLIPH